MFGIALINFLADRQPHVEKNENAAEHVRAVKSGDREIAGEIGAVPRTERIDSLHIFLLDLCHLVGGGQRNEMRAIVRRIVWISVSRIHRDFVFLGIRIRAALRDFPNVR